MDGMSGGTPPTRVFCSGHSLGAGLVSVMRLHAWLQQPSDLHRPEFANPPPDVHRALLTGTTAILRHHDQHAACKMSCLDVPRSAMLTCLCELNMVGLSLEAAPQTCGFRRCCAVCRPHCVVCGRRCSGLLLMSGWSQWAARQWAT